VTELDQVWRPDRWTRVGAWALGLVGALLSVAGLGSAVTGDASTGLVAAAVFGLFPLVAWRWGTHPRLSASGDGIAVRNPLRTTVVPWSDVERCVPGALGLVIERRAGTGKPVVAWAVRKPDLALWLRRRTRADEVAAALEERAVS
jgi:Bacterial PH domain